MAVVLILLIGGYYLYNSKPKPTYVNDGTNTPTIDSITPAQLQVGTPVTIQGKYLNGFEGGTDIWFENTAGESGVIEASSYAPAGAASLTLTLPSRLCRQSMGESGAPCPSYLDVSPGSYKVFVKAWSFSSNKVSVVVK